MFIFLYEPDDVTMENEQLTWQYLPKGCFQTNSDLKAVGGEALSGIYFHADKGEKPKSGSMLLRAFRKDGKRHLFEVTFSYEFGITSQISVWRATLTFKKRTKTW
jgi:hypothetical protein